MGLLSRIGKNVAEQFPNSWRGRSPMETVLPSAMLGASIGGIGAAAQPGDMTNDQFGTAAGIGALAGAAVPLGIGAKRVVVAIARALKQRAPQLPDEAILGQAQKMAEAAQANPSARAQLESILGKMDWGQ